MAAGTGGFSTPPPDYVSDDESVYDAYDAFDFPGKEHNLTAVADRRVKVLIKDAHDHMGPGMTFEVKYLSTLKSAFGCFKAASCKTCRSSDEMRFKTKEKRIEESDTPMSLRLTHNTTIEIFAWSNVPGLQCKACKSSGYPKTNGLGKTVPSLYQTKAKTAGRGKTLAITVQDQTGFDMSVKMLSTVSMEYLMNAYATRTVRDPAQLRFFYDGERLASTETPQELGISNDDVVDVFIEQLGG